MLHAEKSAAGPMASNGKRPSADGTAFVTKKSKHTGDVNVINNRPLIPPEILEEELPITPEVEDLVNQTREAIQAVLQGQDDRLVCIVGPCSIHDPAAALEYAEKLKGVAGELASDLIVVMRVYFEKPRTTVGWKGLINDPDLTGTFNVNKGLKVARELLLAINAMGVPAGTEYLDTITPNFIADTIAWGAIGARTTESQCHRELASGTSCPVGFKNGTSGNVQIAADAIMAASHPHAFMGVSKSGLAAVVETAGNKFCHLILRGGDGAPNYDARNVAAAVQVLQASGVSDKVMIDCSHANSSKKYQNQPLVCSDVAGQVANGDQHIFGVMIESNLKEGNQKIGAGGLAGLEYGVSVTDACVSFDATLPMLRELAEAVRARRSKAASA